MGKPKAKTNPNKRPLPNRAPKKGDRIEYQWDDAGLVYKKGLVQRGGKNTMKVKWDEEGLQDLVDVKGKDGWWFFESGNAKRRKKAWKPPALEKEEKASEDTTLTRCIPRFMKSSTEGPPPKGKHKVVRFFQRQHLKVGGPTMDCVQRLGCLFTTHIRFTRKHKKIPKQHVCRLQPVELVSGHEAVPPKGIECLIFWIKIDVVDNAAAYGGDFKALRLVVCHFDKKLAGSTTKMPIFECRMKHVAKFGEGLLCRACGDVGLVKALGLKFDKFCETWQKLKPAAEAEDEKPADALPDAKQKLFLTPEGRGMRVKIESARMKGYLPRTAVPPPQPDDGKGLKSSAIELDKIKTEAEELNTRISAQRRKIEHLEEQLSQERIELATALKRIDTVVGQREAHSTGKGKMKKKWEDAMRRVKDLEIELEEAEPKPVPTPTTPELERDLATRYRSAARPTKLFVLVAQAETNLQVEVARARAAGLAEARAIVPFHASAPARPQFEERRPNPRPQVVYVPQPREEYDEYQPRRRPSPPPSRRVERYRTSYEEQYDERPPRRRRTQR